MHARPHVPAGKRGPRAQADESSDTSDTIDWLLAHVPANSGRVGIMGISYPGFYAAAAMIESHPALVCASPQAPLADFWDGDDWFHNGAFRLIHCFRWVTNFGKARTDPTRPTQQRAALPPYDYGTPDGYEFYCPHRPGAVKRP